jgi:dTDP-4-amino-4,6-dideoxygalactose transaminase
MIRFNVPPVVGNEMTYIQEAINSGHLSGDNLFTKKCQQWFKEKLKCKSALLTPSCTHALEMAAILIDIQKGDEVIMPSYTFVSTANAFVLRGAKIVFVDICKDTMNIDPSKIEHAITSKTKAIVPVHYAGVACDMNMIMDIAKKHDLFVIEDAAQAMMSKYHGKDLGSIGHMAAFSFHETKNYTSGGEGGALIINERVFVERAEIIREKGTNRSQFFRGEVDKYSWVDIGSSYLMNEISAAYLWAQLEACDVINNNRMHIWDVYYNKLKDLGDQGFIELPLVPKSCCHNGHMFYFKTKSIDERGKLLKYLKKRKVNALFHYIPLHSSTAGLDHGRFNGLDIFTTNESERLIRLPLYYQLEEEEIYFIIDCIYSYFN